MNDEIKDNFKNSSMSHVLAISGMHVAYVILGVQFILDKLINSRKLKNYITIGILGFFVIITGRSSIMHESLYYERNAFAEPKFLPKKQFLCYDFVYFSCFTFYKSIQYFCSAVCGFRSAERWELCYFTIF